MSFFDSLKKILGIKQNANIMETVSAVSDKAKELGVDVSDGISKDELMNAGKKLAQEKIGDVFGGETK